VLTTFFIMGFGYFVAVTALDGHFRKGLGLGRGSRSLAWSAFFPLRGQASVLFTFTRR
jgi:hypothetical protein